MMDIFSFNKSDFGTNESLKEDTFLSKKIARALHLYVSPVFLVVGLFGSILTFLIMYKNAKKHSTYLYLSALAIADVLALDISCGVLFILHATDGKLNIEKQLKCGTFSFLVFSFQSISVYLVVFVAIDRFISVYFPFAAKFISTTHKAVVLCIFIVLSQFAINAHFLWTYTL